MKLPQRILREPNSERFTAGSLADYSGSHKYVPIESLGFNFFACRRMISFRSGSCLRKLERVKANIIKELP
jgi:hypothetical protein